MYVCVCVCVCVGVCVCVCVYGAPGGQCGVQWDDTDAACLGHALYFPLDALARFLNLFLSSQEKENVTAGLFHEVDLHGCADSSLSNENVIIQKRRYNIYIYIYIYIYYNI